MNHVTQTLNSADISIFSTEISRFCYTRNTDIDCSLVHKFLILLVFLEFLKICMINLVIILTMSARIATPGLPKMTVFLSKGHDVIILSRDSNHIVDVFMCPKFGNCSISMRKVITTSIL